MEFYAWIYGKRGKEICKNCQKENTWTKTDKQLRYVSSVGRATMMTTTSRVGETNVEKWANASDTKASVKIVNSAEWRPGGWRDRI